MNYIVIAMMSIFGLCVCAIGLHENEMISTERKKVLRNLAPLIIVEIILDTVAFELEGRFINSFVFRSIKILEFILTPLIPAMMAQAVTRRYYWEKMKKFFLIIFVVNAVFELLNFVIPLAFYLDENIVYHRTIIGYLYLFHLVLSIALLVFCSLNTFVQNTRVSQLLLAMIILVCFGIGLRIAIEKCNCDWLAITFCYFSIIQLHDNSFLKVDGLTKLLNRRAYDNKVKTINYRSALIIIDVNNFKEVNDTYGHDWGDWALHKISEAILSTYSAYGYCYRYGGDEFAVILKENVIKRWQTTSICQDKYKLLTQLMQKLDKELADMERHYDDPKIKSIIKNGVSQGFGIFLPDLSDDSYQKMLDSQSESDYPDNSVGRTWEEVFQIADQRMYKGKKMRAVKKKKGS